MTIMLQTPTPAWPISRASCEREALGRVQSFRSPARAELLPPSQQGVRRAQWQPRKGLNGAFQWQLVETSGRPNIDSHAAAAPQEAGAGQVCRR